MRAEIDGAGILDEARGLAFPRYPGTDGDRRAIALISRAFADAGLDVEEQEFSYDIRVAFRALRTLLAGTAVIVAAAGWLGPSSPGGALALLAVGLIGGGLLLAWSPGAERLYARPGPTVTKNVAGYRRAGEPRRRLILMAHHDSKSQNLTFAWRMGLTLAAILGGLALAAVLIVALLAVARSPSWAAPACGTLTALALAVLASLRSGNDSPGGVDNAGSVAIVLALSRVLPDLVAPDVELIFLSTGAEEDHMVGAMRWLEAHREELEACPVLALNFDGAGAAGRTVLIERYGLGRPLAPTVSAVARRVARRRGLPCRSIVMPPAMGIDAIPFAHRGIECLTLSSGRLDAAAVAVHSSGDTADHLDSATLERIAEFAREVVLELAATGESV